jgi:hypothetical protein
MKQFILFLLLSVLTSLTTVTVASPIEAKGLVISQVVDFKIFPHYEFSKEVTITEQLKIDPRRSDRDIIKWELNPILHIDPGQSKKTFYNISKSHFNIPLVNRQLHIDPGN